MVPATIHSSVRSGAERRLFRQLATERGTEAWVCLHSLALARHHQKRRGEIDFVLVTSSGVLVLEVKGGRVGREGGIWTFVDRYGMEHRRVEGPFDQAASAMFALERDVKSALGSRFATVLFGHGVVLPDIEFAVSGPDIAPEIVYDSRDRGRPFGRYVERLVAFTQRAPGRARRGPTAAETEELLEFLRGDFDFVPSFGAMADDTRFQIEALTREQHAVLDALDEPRAVVDGPAGSGKTVLALEAARREARTGSRTLLLCFNRLLAARSRAALEDESFPGSLTVATVTSFFRSLIQASSLRDEFAERAAMVSERDLFETLFAEFAALAALETVGATFDSLVIDEAQDVLTEANLSVLSEVLRGGIDDGRWRVFLDSNNQASVFGRLNPTVMSRLKTLGGRTILTVNCRNTRPIAIQTTVLSVPKVKSDGRIDGLPVEFRSFTDEGHCLGQLERVLGELRHEMVSPGRTTILLPTQPTEKVRRALVRMNVRQINDEDAAILGTAHLTDLTWCSVSGFKGLENDIVVLMGVTNVEADWWRSVIYVGMSRARVRLFVLLHENCDAVRRVRVEQEAMARLSEEVTQ